MSGRRAPQPLGAVIVYEAPGGGPQVEVILGEETVWLSQAQMVELFGRHVSVVARDIANVFREGELPRESNSQILQIASGGDRPTTFYNLDVVISVGEVVAFALLCAESDASNKELVIRLILNLLAEDRP